MDVQGWGGMTGAIPIMTRTFAYAAIVAAMSFAAPALAQQASSSAAPSGADSTPPPAADAATPSAVSGSVGASAGAQADAAPSAATGSATNTSATVSTGMTVKDSSGASIGQITDVKADASGQKTATIKMGTDTFAVGASSLAVQDGAAVVNATQAELRQMLKK